MLLYYLTSAGVKFANRDTFAQEFIIHKDTFAQGVTFAKRHFCTS